MISNNAIQFLSSEDFPSGRAQQDMLLYCLNGQFLVQRQIRSEIQTPAGDKELEVQEPAVHREAAREPNRKADPNSINMIRMLAKDILVINEGEQFHINAEDAKEDTFLLALAMEHYELQRQLARPHFRIVLSSAEHRIRDYGRLRFLLDSITKLAMDSGRKTSNTNTGESFKIRSLYYSIWDIVCEQFIPSGPQEGEAREAGTDSSGNGRTAGRKEEILQILADIDERYSQPLSLSSLARRYYMTESAFSRFFRRQTGENFADYLRKVRMQHARELLLTTDKSVTEIAYDCGFASLSVFNKNFRQYFQSTPGALRARQLDYGQSVIDRQEQVLHRLSDLRPEMRVETSHGTCSVFVDPRKTTGTGGFFTDVLNVGMAVELLEERIRSQLVENVSDLGVRYIRISNLFDPSMHIRSGHTTEYLNFEKLDDVLDFLIGNGLTPVLELPEKIHKLLIEVGGDFGRYQDLQGRQPVPVFETLSEWFRVLEMFLHHVVHRYTRLTVETWVFEIWYDIEHATGAGRLDFLQLYQGTYQRIRKTVPGARILASGLTAGMDAEELGKQLRFFKGSGLLPDGLSLLIYPYHPDEKGMAQQKKRESFTPEGDGPAKKNTQQAEGGIYYQVSRQDDPFHARPHIQIVSDEDFITKELEAYRQVMVQEDYPDTPLWITEWNTSLSQRNAYNDSTAKGCHMLTQITAAYGKVKHMGYWLLSDWSSQAFDSGQPFMGANGLLSKDGIRKPSYYALMFSFFLGQKILARGKGFLVTIRDDGNYTILLYNPRQFGSVYRQRREGDLRTDDLDYIFQDDNSVSYDLIFSGMKSGVYEAFVYHVNGQQDDPLTEWRKLGFRQNLRPSEVSYLKAVTIPRLTANTETVSDGRLQMKQTISANEFMLILLSPLQHGK